MHNQDSEHGKPLCEVRDRLTKSFIALDRLGWLINAGADCFTKPFPAYLINVTPWILWIEYVYIINYSKAKQYTIEIY